MAFLVLHFPTNIASLTDGFLEDLAESDTFDGSTTNLSNTEDNTAEETTHELRMMRRQMEGLEAMYQVNIRISCTI